MLHRPEQLISKKGSEIYKKLKIIKKKGIIKKIGYSFYNDKYLNLFSKKFKPDTIQFPLNILNNKFTSKKNIKILKKKHITFQVRSIFLQGILLNNNKNISKLKSLKKYLKQLENFQKKNKLNKIECCINFIKSQKYIDEIVVGCDSYKNFIQIKKALRNKKTKYPKIKVKKSDKNLIDPRQWS